MPADIPARTRLPRREERLRCRRLRRLHRADRRRAGALVPDPGLSRRRVRDHHRRGFGPRWRIASDAAGVFGCAGLSMRVLHRGHDRHRLIIESGAVPGPCPLAQRKHLPLHRLSRHRGCDPRRQQCAGRCARQLLRPEPPGAGWTRCGHRQRALHPRRRHGRIAASEIASLTPRACAHSRRRPHRGDGSAGRRGRLHLRGCAATAVFLGAP